MAFSHGVVKRGYLFDKKGILDRKRWYVLRHDLAQHSCLLEIYKDEKSASRPEPPKTFINVHDVVEVHRITERKQSFEILCPGIGYKFMANSDVEADEWVEALRKLILYRRDTSFTPAATQPSLPPQPAVHSAHTQPMAIAPPHTPSAIPAHGYLSSSQPESLALQLAHSPSCAMPGSLPTPPETATSPPLSLHQPLATSPPQASHQSGAMAIVRQRSTEFAPLPSPPSTSSDSSSMCSGSNASFEPSPSEAEGEAKSTHFRVHVKETDGLLVSGPVDLVLAEDAISLCSIESGQQLVSWPIATLRRYGVNSVSFTIITGRNSSTGEGRYQFYTHQSRLLYSRVHAMAVHKAAAKSQSLRRAGSEVSCRAGSECAGSERAVPFGTSPPSLHYNHIEHTLHAPSTVEEYSRLGSSVEYSRLLRQSSATLPARPHAAAIYPPSLQHFCSQCTANHPGQAHTLPVLRSSVEGSQDVDQSRPPISPRAKPRSRSITTSTLC